MKIFEANITQSVIDFLYANLKNVVNYKLANKKLLSVSGIRNFFDNVEDFELLKEKFSSSYKIGGEPDRTEYGDFQTNIALAIKTVSFIKGSLCNPKIIIEPTCGKGNFIVASIQVFDGVEKIYGVEVYKPYVWETKFNVLSFYLSNPTVNKPEIEILHFNVFDYDFSKIAQEHSKDEILIVGNPPWVTNSKLSVLNSNNLPVKSNFKKHNGIDAITGKGNFDIGEYITLMMFDAFQNSIGCFSFLLKNAVIKNIVHDQKSRSYNISNLQKHSIDSKKEFGVSVEASMFFCEFNTSPQYECTEYDFYNKSNSLNKFGWVGDKFVSDIKHYEQTNDIDGECPFKWRQGIKHDCSSIMELEKANDHFVNGLGQPITLEEGLVYGLLKSSDLKKVVINNTRKYTIITQQRVGEETSYIQNKYPKTYEYLIRNKPQFDLRKSSIYKNKPSFSIFGIGEYSFKPFKVSISGLYKNYSFNLVLPHDNKPIMLDDTCYFIGFEKLAYAIYSLMLLNSEIAKNFLRSITFPEAKRTFTKDTLMRIDLLKIALGLSKQEIQKEINIINKNYNLEIQDESWDEFIQIMTPIQSSQINIFA